MSGEATSTQRLASSLQRLQPALKANGWLILLIAALGTLVAFAEMVSILLVVVLMAALFGSAETVRNDVPDIFVGLYSAIAENVQVATILLLLFLTLRLVIKAWYGVLIAGLQARSGHELRMLAFDRILGMSFDEIGRRSWGDLHSLTWEYAGAVPAGLKAVCEMTRAGTVVVILSLLLLIYSPILSVLAVGTFFLLSRTIELARRPIIAAGEQTSDAYRIMSEYLIRTLSALRTIVSLGMMREQSQAYGHASLQAREAEERVARFNAMIDPASHIAVLLSLVVMALAASTLDIAAAKLLVSIGLLYRIQPYFASLQEQRLELQRLNRSLARGEEMPSEDGREALESFPVDVPFKDIEFQNVTFGYSSRKEQILSDTSFTIPACGWTLLEGPSGSGKSTIVNLLLGFMAPEGGRIACGDLDLARYSPSSWRRRIAICGQDIDLLDGSLRDNLTLQNQRTTEERALDVLALVGLQPLMDTLPDGLETLIGEQGKQLSGGQRQRLAIARALLRNPDMLILDEATGMIDADGQRLLLSQLHRELGNCTVLLIGHHLPFVPPIASRITL